MRRGFCVFIIFLLFFGCRHYEQNEQGEKLKNVEIIVLDGVNGSPVSQTILKIYEKDKLERTLIVQNGKVDVALKEGQFYDFKLEGRKNLKPYYAASLVSSYLIEENTKHITILQAPLSKITKNTINPEVSEVKIENQKIEKWNKTPVSILKGVSFTLKSAYPCEEIKLETPHPMMALGYVPSTMDEETCVLSAIQINKKEGDSCYVSLYEAHLDSIKIKAEMDIVIVAYDVAANRIEHHVRIFPEENAISEDESIKIEDLRLKLKMYPTPSQTFAIGKDPTTGCSTHYEATLFFNVKKGVEHVDCSSFELYRKEKTQKDFVLVKRIENISNSPDHKIIDTDGMLEEEKEYSYKIVAFTKGDAKSSFENVPEVTVKVMRPSPLILINPQHNAIIKYSEAKNLSYSLKIATPQILENAKYMELGFMLSERGGKACYACKFKYVFNKKGDDELYFATLSDVKKTPSGMYLETEYSQKLISITSKPVQTIVDVNDINGVVTLTKDFITLPINLVATPFSYQKGATYYWDIVDWGLVDGLDVSYDDFPCHVVCDGNNDGSSEVIYYFNDKAHGSNAWNGREVFSIKY